MCFGISFGPNVLLGLLPFIFPAVSVDCCASLVGAWLFCLGHGAHPGPSQVRLPPACVRPVRPAGDAALPPWGPCRNSHCWGRSALWTLAKERSSAWRAVVPDPSLVCTVSSLLVCLFTPTLPQKLRVTWPTLGAL